MSLVGPRPPLPVEDADFEGHVRPAAARAPGHHRAVAGERPANLAWDDSVRLDLYYVENWSPVLDLEILWKTIFTVFTGAGAR